MDRPAALPPAVRMLIHSGEVVYAQAPARQADHDASVSIRAVIDEQKGHWKWLRSPDKSIIIRHNPNDDPIIGYEVLHREWDHKEYRQDPYGVQVDYQQKYKVQSEIELMNVLHTLHLNGAEFSLQDPFY